MKELDPGVFLCIMSKGYLISIILTVLVLPVTGTFVEHIVSTIPLSFALFSKWFIFSAGGLRLLIAGLKQVLDPGFTAKGIFHMEGSEALPVVRELGYANICLGLVGAISLFAPSWQVVCAFASGLYFMIAGVQHLIIRPAGANERLALWSDLLIASLLAAAFITRL